MNKSSFIKAGEVNTHYIRKGKGMPLILIHGIFSSSFVWHKNIEELSRNFDVIALDLKGCGYSDKPEDNRYRRQDVREFIADFMDALKVNKATLIGHSIGGSIAMDFALSYPQRAEKLILIDSICYPLRPTITGWLLKVPLAGELAFVFSWKKALKQILLRKTFFNPSLFTQEELKEWMRPFLDTPEAIRANFKLLKMDAFIGQKMIKAISHSALIIWGKEDRIMPVKMAERLNRDIENSILRIIPECGHNPQEEKPDAVNRIIREFMEGSQCR